MKHKTNKTSIQFFYYINYINALETNEFENPKLTKVSVNNSISSKNNKSNKYFIGISTGFAFNQNIVQEKVSNSKVANGLFYFAKQMPIELFGDIVINKTITLQPSIQFLTYNFKDTTNKIERIDSFITYRTINQLNRCYFYNILDLMQK